MKDEKYWEDLGRRAVACEGWRWMPGMLAMDCSNDDHPGRVVDDRQSLVYEDGDGAVCEGVVSRSDVPDLRDPATVGCLLALVREKHGPEVHCVPTVGGRWEFHARSPGRPSAWTGICKDTNPEALVAALEQVGP